MLVLISLGRGLKLPRRVLPVATREADDALELCVAELVRIRLAPGIEPGCDCAGFELEA